ncbi:MAG: DNA repair protein RecN [Bacteroidota bacterium]
MLAHLTIRNYALIRHLELAPGAGLNAITGETGAGKSIMLGAIGLLLGNRADTKVLLDETGKCITEGTFHIGNYGLEDLFADNGLDHHTETILRREISPGGKSRAFINDTPVTLDVMKNIGLRLMDVHSQHETLELGGQSFQLRLIDAYAGNGTLRDRYRNAWESFRYKRSALEELERESARLRNESDFVRFQHQELMSAMLKEGEDRQLADTVKTGEHAELISNKLIQVLAALSEGEYSGKKAIGEARSIMNGLAGFSSELAQLQSRLESVRLELEDIVAELEHAGEKMQHEPEALEAARQRLDILYGLQRKHRVNTVTELLELQERLGQQVYQTDHLDELITSAKKELDLASAELKNASVELSTSRQAVFKTIEKEAVRLLRELGIPDAQLVVRHTAMEPGATGADNISIYFSANKGIEPRPIAAAASGGEFSRLMFVIKYVMAEKTAMPTLILDEIDSGVSGDIALKLGNLMRTMAGRHQVLAITHLPQIAARATDHFVVFKENSADRTASQLRQLKEEERVTEIARIISGNNPSHSALTYAKELLS